jgi:transcriptional regulator GlxA family with amidase domain
MSKEGFDTMKRITILAMYNTMASTVIGPMDVFYQAGVIWNYIHGQAITPYFDIKMVTSDGKPFKCLNGVRMLPQGSMNDVQDCDMIIISSILNIEKTLKYQGQVIDWLTGQYRRGVQIATICTGAFVLAETGLLDGKTATTHWGFADQFRKRYPRIELKIERLITDEGDLFCSGGYNAGTDLSLYLVEKYCGHEIALQSSKSIIADIGRTTQAPYAIFEYQKDHNDSRILSVQQWIEDHFEQNFNYEQLARKYGMSRRTFERRFKTATGDTPLIYQQRIRVEAAKRMLEGGSRSFDEITYQVGYEDSSSFRKVFSKHTGLRPTEYQKKFQRV